jgi:DNA-binding transcriptional MerR regulator
MKNGERSLWTIDELSDRVAEALRAGYEGVPSGRVRDVPDLRTIRYYTTLGLLDRPAAMQGRTALYGPRHLLQLVAIKRLQSRGLSLAAVQERVVGLSNTALRKIAALPAPRPELDPTPARGDSFWRLPAPTQVSPGQCAALDVASCALGSDEAVLPAAGSELQTIPLGDGLVLSLTTRRGIDADDIRSIRMAAASLIEVLRLRGLIDSDTDTDTDTDTGTKKPGDAR